MIFARKINKIPEFYTIFARKMPEFYIIIARKIFFPNLGGGGGNVPPQPPAPVSYAYGLLFRRRAHLRTKRIGPVVLKALIKSR